MNDVKIKTINFSELLTSITQQVEIPLLQRDYAQGRKNQGATTIRVGFLNVIFDHLNNNKELKLDFIYGTVENKRFVPLDGQQRLTTLFLLYWYCAIAKNKITEFRMKFVDDEESRFRYTTRSSATEFCNALVDSNNMSTLQNILKSNPNIETEGEFLKEIKKSKWYYSTWKHDPTVTGMLTMLEAIHQKYIKYHETQHWQYTNLDTIKFEFIDLETFKLTDDLYVKMNARGKQLTHFEIFKAKFERYIQDKRWEENIPDAKYREKFANKVDNEWTDLFWQLIRDNKELIDSNKESIAQEVDRAHITCIATIAMISIALSKKASVSERSKQIEKLLNNPELVEPSNFEEDGYDMLVKTLDTYCKFGHNIKIDIEWWNLLEGIKPKLEDGTETVSLFAIFLAKQPTYPHRALFYAQTQYLIRYNRIDKNFWQWMRVARNSIYTALAEGTKSERFASIVPTLFELIENSNGDIYGYLKTMPKEEFKFIEKHMRHEQAKARLLLNTNLVDNQNNIIYKLEDTNFSRGDIAFPLYCVNIEQIDVNRKLSPEQLDKLSKIEQIIRKHFTNNIKGNLRRALLTIYENDYYTYKSGWSDKFNAPNYCLISDIEYLRNFSKSTDKGEGWEAREYREYLKELVNELTAPNSSLDYIIKKFKQNITYRERMDKWQQLMFEPKCLGDDRHHIIPNPQDYNTNNKEESEKAEKTCVVILWGHVRPGKINYKLIDELV